MSLSKRLETAAATVQRTACRTCAWYATLPKTDQAAFDTWLASDYPRSLLHEHCVAEGLTAKISAFRDHCRGNCAKP